MSFPHNQLRALDYILKLGREPIDRENNKQFVVTTMMGYQDDQGRERGGATTPLHTSRGCQNSMIGTQGISGGTKNSPPKLPTKRKPGRAVQQWL
jgi:hypothetical protein